MAAARADWPRRTEEQAARRELLRVKRSLKSRRTRIVLALAESQVLRRTVELPAAASENLREVLGFEMDRHTPFKAEDVYLDHRVLGQDGQRKRMTIELLVVPRRVADRAMTIAEALGSAPTGSASPARRKRPGRRLVARHRGGRAIHRRGQADAFS